MKKKRMTKRSEVDCNFAVLSDAVMQENLNHPWQIVDILAHRLAEYEDLGFCPDELREIIASFDQLKREALPWMALLMKGKLMEVPAVGEQLFEADPEHGVILHEVTDVHWIANTKAMDGNCNSWADYWTDADIYNAFENEQDAASKLEELSK